MPILDLNTEEPEQPTIDPVVEVNKEEVPSQGYTATYRDNVMRSKDTGLSNLLPHITGSPWNVHFYLDKSGHDQGNEGFNPEADEGQIFQQFHLIRGLELRVTSPLQRVLNDTTNAHVLEGEANFYARVKPNEGNVFVADIGGGRSALFEITRSVPASVLKSTIYQISYRSIYEMTPHIQSVLDNCTIKTSVFVKESLFGISRGLFSSEEHNLYLQAKTRLRALQELYGREFYDEKNDTLMLVPEYVYDPYVINFFNKLVADEYHRSRHYRELIIEYGGLKTASIYQKILGEHWPPHKYMTRFRLAAVREAHAPLVFGGIAVTDILDYVDKSVTAEDTVPVKSEPLETLPLFHALPLDYYVFTSDLYLYDQPMSVLEEEVLKLMTGKPISIEAVSEMTSDAKLHALSPSQRFYYMPLLILLLGVIIREY